MDLKTVKSETMRKIILPCLLVLCLSFNSFSQGTSCATAHVIPINGSCNNYAMGPVGSMPTADFSAIGTAGVVCGPAASYPANRRVTWFKFTPATDILTAEFQINTDPIAQTQIAFYDPNTGACPASITSTAAGSGLQVDAGGTCDADGQSIVWHPANTNILRAGKTYYLRIYVNTTNTSAYNINICATPLPVAQVNTILLNNSPTNHPVGPLGAGRNFSSLGGSSAQRCNYTANRRVTWFKFTPATTTNCATFNINADDPVNTEVAFFDPSQASPLITNSTLCLPNGYGVFAPKTNASTAYTLVGGQTYYLRIYTNTNNNNPLNINIQAASVIPPNDLCTGATQLDLNGINNENNVCMTGAANEPAYIVTNSSSWICAPILHNTAWYYFEVANSAAPTALTIDQVHCVNNGSDASPQIQVGMLVQNGGSCLTNNNLQRPGGISRCYQGAASPSAVITIPANTSGIVSGSTRIYVTVDGRNGSNCSYRLLPTNAIPIPVKIKLFTGWKQSNRNQLKWVTTTELNNAYFEIERSTDGKNFVAIGRVEGAGNSNEEVQYKFDDLNYPMVAYYRLKQVDFDGKSDYTHTVLIKRDDISSMLGVSFANPVVNNSRVTISTHRPGLVNVRVVDMSGRTLSTQQVECVPGNTNVMKDFSKLAAGSYYLVIMQGDDKLVKPFVKQ